ncbi:MAG: hypothetical protein MJ109_05160 [Kiritimatiellae bacterium]|nr:hypothetical protein [Kiritimatiellia bacterium]
MKKVITRMLAFAALMLCGGAWADAMPVAVWAGNFETKTQGAFTLDLNGNSESTDHSKITINQNVGVKVDTTTAVSGITVLFRVENLEVGESVKTLATVNAASGAGSDRSGVYLDANGLTHGIWWNGSALNTYDTGATQSSLASIENTAYMALAYSTGGTSFYINTGSGYKSAHVNGNQKASGDTSLYGVCVGGTRSHGANFVAASGMVITGIAVFNERLSNTIALSNYQFPDEAQVWLHSKFGSQHNAANEISSSAKVVFPAIKTLEDLQNNYVLSGTINGDWMKDGNYSYTVYPVKVAEEKDGEILTSLTMQFHGVNDGNMKVATVKFTCSDDGISAQQTGQRYLTPGSNNAATYLFKQEITGGTGVGVNDYTIYSLAAYPKSQLTLPEATAKVISWNVAQGETKVAGKGEQKTLVGNIPEAAWTEKAGVNQYTSTDYTDVKVYDVASGETTTDTSIKFRWSVTGAANYGFLQAGSNANDAAIESDYEYMGMWMAKLDKSESATSFSVSGIPFMSYDVILYYNGNAGFDSYQIRPITINGAKYNVNRKGELVSVGSAADGKALWGQRGLSRPELGVNAGIIKNLSAGTLTITDSAKGGGLAAIQIVEHPVRTTNVTISGDDNLVSTLAADHSFGKDPVIITADGAATLTVDEAWTYGPLILASESGTLTIKGADNLPLDELDFSRVAESLVFEFDATTTEYTATEKVKAYMATMSDEKVTFLFKGSETSGATVAYTENAPIITGHLVFQGGAHHVFKYNGGDHIFASGASNDHPTILVESDTTLTVYGHDMTGYNATPTADGVIRVKDRGTLVFENYGESGTTFFYSQRICLDPGAEWTIGESLTGADFRMTGGSSIDQVFVPESATDATANPARITVSTGAHLNLAKDGSAQGVGINVGANSKLVFDGDVQSLNNDANVATDDETLAVRVIEKKGTGVLEIVGGNVSATMKPSAGTLRYVAVSPAATSFGDGTLELAQNENGDAYTFTGTVSSSALGKGVVKTVAGSTVSLCGTFTDYSGDINSSAANSKFVIPVGQEVTVGLIASNSKIEIEGTLANTNKTAGTGQYDYTNYQPSNLSGLTGNGTFKIVGPHYFFTSGTTNFSDYWASTLAICNERGESEPGDNRGIVWGQPDDGNKTISIGTLSGFGMMRTDANRGTRNIKVTQAVDSEWSGVFYGTNDRLGTFIVAGKDGATAKTLTLSGTQTHTNDLTIEESGSAKITGTWIATTTTVNGRLEVMNTATLTSPTLTYGYKMDTSDSVIYFGSKDIAEAEAVAQVGDDYYATLEKAFEAASEGEGLSVTLTANVAGDLNVPENMTVNVGSHTIGGEIVIGERAVVTIAGDRETQGISGRGKLVVTSGTVTAKNKSGGYAVDGATIQIDGGTFKLNLGNAGAFSVAASDPSINDAKFIIGASGTLTNNGWLNISGELSLSSEATKTVFSGSSFRGAPTVVKSGNGAITFDLSNANGSEDYKFTSLTMNAGSLMLKTAVAVDSPTSGVDGKVVNKTSGADDTTVYSLVDATSDTPITPEEGEIVVPVVPDAGIAIEPGADVKVPTNTDVSKIEVVYNGVELSKAVEGESGHPKYVEVSINETTGAVELTTTDSAKPAETDIAMSTPTEGEGEEATDKVQFTITNPIPGLFYAVSSCDTPDGTFESATGDQATSSAAKTVSIPMTFGENQKVKYYRVNVKATK